MELTGRRCAAARDVPEMRRLSLEKELVFASSYLTFLLRQYEKKRCATPERREGGMSIIPHRSRGIRRIFTLIELLITIADHRHSGRDAAAGLNQALERGRETLCVSNIKQIGTAIVSYSGGLPRLPAPAGRPLIAGASHRGRVATYMGTGLSDDSQKGCGFCPSFEPVPPAEGRKFFGSYKSNLHLRYTGLPLVRRRPSGVDTQLHRQLQADPDEVQLLSFDQPQMRPGRHPGQRQPGGRLQQRCLLPQPDHPYLPDHPLCESGSIRFSSTGGNAPFLLANGSVITRRAGSVKDPSYITAKGGWQADFK